MNTQKNLSEYFKVANDCGLSYYTALDISTLEFLQEVRDMCNEAQCHRYNTSWSCPPACPPLDELRERALSYTGGIIVQTAGEIEDSLDWEAMMEIEKKHKANFAKFCDELKKEFSSIMPMSAGSCALCENCAYPENPCRFPEKMSPSMEACGIFVSKLCKSNGLEYNYGPEKMAYTSCVLFNV